MVAPTFAGFSIGSQSSEPLVDERKDEQRFLLDDPYGPRGGEMRRQFMRLIANLPAPIGIFVSDQQLGLHYASLVNQAQEQGKIIHLVGIHDDRDPLAMATMHRIKRPLQQIGLEAGRLLWRLCRAD